MVHATYDSHLAGGAAGPLFQPLPSYHPPTHTQTGGAAGPLLQPSRTNVGTGAAAATAAGAGAHAVVVG